MGTFSELDWQRHAQKSRPPSATDGGSRGKGNSRAPYRAQITMAETRAEEPATQRDRCGQPRQGQQQGPLWSANYNGRDTRRRAGDPARQTRSAAARATAGPPIERKLQWQRHAQKSRRPSATDAVSRGKGNSSQDVEGRCNSCFGFSHCMCNSWPGMLLRGINGLKKSST